MSYNKEFMWQMLMQCSRLWYTVQWHLQLLSHKSRRPSESHVNLHVSVRGTLEAVESFRSIIRAYSGTSLLMDDNHRPPAAGASQQHRDDDIKGFNWHTHSPDMKGATTVTWSHELPWGNSRNPDLVMVTFPPRVGYWHGLLLIAPIVCSRVTPQSKIFIQSNLDCAS